MALCALLGACSREDPHGANVVVVALDTLRADHVGVYGYPRPTTPRIDAFARDAVYFQTAVSQSSWTTPAFASMFTGLVPSAHGAGDGRCPDVTVLDGTHETLASALRAAGYRTASFVSNDWVSAEVGLTRGFDEHARFRFSEEAVDRAIAWLGAGPRRPFFLFVHVMDPHQPWVPLPEDAALFLDPEYRGPIGNGFMGGVKPGWNAADRRRIVDLYDGAIRRADRLLGRVLDALNAHGLTSRTIVTVVSDHGEELFDRGRIGHGHSLYDEQLLVPFLIRVPGVSRRGPIDQPVRTMDLFPTVLDAVGLPVPHGLDAVSLMPLVRGDGEPPGTDTALAEHPCFAKDLRLRALRTPSEKLLHSPVTQRVALFDLSTDPRERTDVAAARPESVALLRRRMADAVAREREGFHLIARAGGRDAVLRARLEATEGFTAAATVQGERSDRVRLRRGATVLDVKLRLTTRERPPRRVDLDGVSFRTTRDLPFVVRRLEVGGKPLSPQQITLGTGTPVHASAPVELGIGTRGIRAPRWSPPPPSADRRPRVQFSFVPRVEPSKAVISPEMAERLRQMGYVE